MQLFLHDARVTICSHLKSVGCSITDNIEF